MLDIVTKWLYRNQSGDNVEEKLPDHQAIRFVWFCFVDVNTVQLDASMYCTTYIMKKIFFF